MTRFLLIRHGPTEWNAAGRIQGHTNVALSAAGREQVAGQRVPDAYHDSRWVCSPLVRALETARLMGCENPETEPALREMNWGEWEGMTLAGLQQKYGDALRTNEQRGLDFRPGGGESPREVQRRVIRWMRSVTEADSVVAVTHKGVIRAVLSAATGWDMTGPPPLALNWACAHVFDMDDNGILKLRMANLPLQDDTGD